MDASTIRTVLSTNRVDSRSLSSKCWTFRRKHTSADPTRLLCIRLALPLTLFLLSGFVPSTRLMVCAPPRALLLHAVDFSCDCMFWDGRGGGLTRYPVGLYLPRWRGTSLSTIFRVSGPTFLFGQKSVVVDVEGVGLRPRAVAGGRGVVAVCTRVSSQEYVDEN